MTDEIPHWVKVRACELANAEAGEPDLWKPERIKSYPAMRALARHVLKHEQEPVDPLEAEAEELLKAEWFAGRDSAAFPVVMLALKRGIEIGKSS